MRAVENGNKIVIGSRYVNGATAKRKAHRLIASKVYNKLLDVLFGTNIKDSQCGFKFWDGAYIRKGVQESNDNHWFFDSEILIAAKHAGINVYEMPIEWHERKSTHVRLGDIPYFLIAAAALKFRFVTGRR